MAAPEPWRPEETKADKGRALANVFVLVGLVSMLIGAIVIIAARETFTVDVPPGETVAVFTYDAPTWDPLGHPMQTRVFGPANVTLDVEETSGTDARENTTQDLAIGRTLRWFDKAEPGESWVVTVTNHGNETVRTSSTVACDLYYWGGGFFVAIGVLGFVSYRVGMRRSH